MRIEHVTSRINQQLLASRSLSQTIESLNQAGQPSRRRIESRLTTIEEEWEEFRVAHQAINLATSRLDYSEQEEIRRHPYIREDVFEVTRTCYMETVATLNSALDESAAYAARPTPEPSVAPSHTVATIYHPPRLPRIDLPKFDGTLSEWLPFRDLFSSLVLNNNALSSVERLQYLKVSLIGSAAHLLKNTSLVAANFDKAWESVTAFYENDRLLVNSALHSLFSIKRMTKESAAEMETLYTSVTQVYRTLETLKRPIRYWDDILVYQMVQRMDSESIRVWEQQLGSSKEPPSWERLKEFLLTRLRSLQAFERAQPSKPANNPRSSGARSLAVNPHSVDRKPRTCSMCGSDHYISACPEFQQKHPKQRLEFVTSQGLCYNCLGGHRVSACKSTRRCLKCGKRHHSTIHSAPLSGRKNPPSSHTPVGPFRTAHTQAPITPTTQPPPASNIPRLIQHVHSAQLSNSNSVLLATAEVRVVNAHGETVLARVLLDQGSEISLVTERLVQHLQLRRQPSNLRITGVGGTNPGKTRGRVTLVLKPHFESPVTVTVNAFVLDKLTPILPATPIEDKSWPHLRSLTLADPSFARPGKIDILLGADLYGYLLDDSIVQGPLGTPTAQLTKFGWIVSGPVSGTTADQPANVNHCCIDHDLHALLEKFWAQEELVDNRTQTLTTQEQQCETHFQRTHSRDVTGRYVVRLPFKLPPENLGNSSPVALGMLNRLQTKFNSDPKYFQNYADFLSEYRTLGHMTEVPSGPTDPDAGFYLPHHGVLKESSTTTKLRVVFNGSCAVLNGLTLNNILHTGSKLQSNIFDVLIWFRKFRFIFSCDIEKMFRQIRIHEDDQLYQRIYWLDNGKLIRFQLTTVTYGLACAPYLALKTLVQLVEDEGYNYPLAVDSMLRGRYVDDIYGGSDELEDAQRQAVQVESLCQAGGFPLRKWISNHPHLLKNIPQQYHHPENSVTIQDSTIHALGLSWCTNSDSLKFKHTFAPPGKLTKRVILSTIAQLFDPLGLLSPLTITAKIFLQELWLIKTSWDTPLPTSQSLRWKVICDGMSGVDDINISRWIGMTSNDEYELHGFCDASTAAMAAVVYLRTTRPDGVIEVSIICAKTKVAPLKRQTIPRLELMAAVMLTKLIVNLQSTLNSTNALCHLWTDSSIVHTWVNNHPSKWKEFVHNRVCLIQETLPTARWSHISGSTNPADCATRGLTATHLKDHTLWWTGPPWLREDRANWPKTLQLPAVHEPSLEVRKPPQAAILTVCSPAPSWDLLVRYSSLNRLFRMTAICRRVLLRARRTPNSSLRHSITPTELSDAQRFWIRSIQQIHFPTELRVISRSDYLPKTNSLSRLSPFIDSDGLLRVRGRLENAPLENTAKHPFILPSKSPLSTLVIRDAHDRTLHGSTRDTLAYVRHTYWIVGGRAPVRSYILRCVTCTRYRRNQASQLMGQLPPSRVNPSRAFLHSGLDYAGPFQLKAWKGRTTRSYKAWVALFVCLATSAIHLELVTDYSTEAFIAAYRRFTARRGICATLTSDCGTNFKGTDKELRDLFSQTSAQLGDLTSLISRDGTKWNFNPPAAPHFGGKWEAGVKSMKYHLKRVTDGSLLTYEELTTLLNRIEAVLNSRPLCALTEDPDDLDVLTPGHFLVGHSLTLIPEPDLTPLRQSHLSRWQKLTQMLQNFWTKWAREYLQRFLEMNKWNRTTEPLAVGTLVLLIDERYPPGKWPLGRVLTTHPGADGVVRVVTIKTASGVLKRPIVKLCPLPVDNPSNTDPFPVVTNAGGNV